MARQRVVVGVWNKVWLSALLLGMTPALPGCSFLFVTPPPKSSGEFGSFEPVKCTTSKAAPVVDMVIAGLEAARVGYALGASDSDYNNLPISRGTDIALGLGLLALYGASSTYGYVVTGNCKDRRGGAHYSKPVDDPDSPPPPPPPRWASAVTFVAPLRAVSSDTTDNTGASCYSMCQALSQRNDAELASRVQNFGAPGNACSHRACLRAFIHV